MYIFLSPNKLNEETAAVRIIRHIVYKWLAFSLPQPQPAAGPVCDLYDINETLVESTNLKSKQQRLFLSVSSK